MEHKRHQSLWQSQISIYQMSNLTGFIFTFGFVWSSDCETRALIEMDYVTSDNLGNLVGLEIVLEVHFTYAIRLLIIEHVTILLNMFNVPSMTYTTAGPWKYAGMGMPTVISMIVANK